MKPFNSIENAYTDVFVVFVAMDGPQELPPTQRGLSRALRVRIVRLLHLHTDPPEIASQCGVSLSSVYRIRQNLWKYASSRAPRYRKLGQPPKLTKADKDALFEWLAQEGWRDQAEMKEFLWEECGVSVSRRTVGRTLKDNGWTRKSLKRICAGRNERLRAEWHLRMARYTAEDLVFIDESIFNEKTGWRHYGYAPIGHEARYHASISRGDTWAILPAYTVHGYLPNCTEVRKGYFKSEDFLDWVKNRLLPAVDQLEPGRTRVIVMDNVSIHCGQEISDAVSAAGHVLQFLPPYSPDFNPIEMTFAVLKAWIRKTYHRMRKGFPNFGDYLRHCVTASLHTYE